MKLKPCPFCGRAAAPTDVGFGKVWIVGCEDECWERATLALPLDEAATKWNRRAGEAAVARACAEIAEEIMNELPDDAAYVGQAAGACGDIATRIRALAARLEAGEGVDDAE